VGNPARRLPHRDLENRQKSEQFYRPGRHMLTFRVCGCIIREEVGERD